MRTWDDYKRTMRDEDVIFSLARVGDLEAIGALDLTPARLEAKNTKGHSPLMLATYNGHVELARYLLARGADVNTADSAGSSALMGAAFKGDARMIEVLLEHGADPAARNQRNQTAADYARQFGQDAVLSYFDTPKQSPEDATHGQ